MAVSTHDARAIDEGPVEHDVEDRRVALTVVLAGLLRGSDGAPLVALFEAFEEADDHEVASAAGAILTIYLRAGIASRRRQRRVLAEAIRSAAESRLAHALVVRVGAVAEPAEQSGHAGNSARAHP